MEKKRLDRKRAAMWVLLAIALIALPFASSPGMYVFDTRDPLWFHPGTYLLGALQLWRRTPYLGVQQHDGIMVPMGIAVWGLRSMGLPVWVAERIWHGLLLFVAVGGTVLLVDALRGKRTVLAPLTAGLTYALTPYSFGYGLPFTPVWLPYVLLPFLLLVVVRGMGRKGLVWPALFGLVTFLMGGGNGAPQAFVLATAAVLMVWLAITNRIQARRALAFGFWSLVFFIGMNAYWLFLLSSPEVINALKFSEQPVGINITSSASESLRGLGFWHIYGGDQSGPWLVPIRPYVTNPILVLSGFAVPMAAFLSAWLVRWKHRLFFVLLSIVAVFIAVGIFPVTRPSPFGHVLRFLYDRVPFVAGLRTTYKVTAEVNLSLAILAGVGVEALWAWFSVKRALVFRVALLVVVASTIAANAFPLWTGRLYNPHHGMSALPDYWSQTLSYLDARDTSSRVFFVPSMNWPTYNWGALKETVVATDPGLDTIYPRRLPANLRYGSNLIAATEQPYLDGASPSETALLLRYLGVGEVVLQNDIDWERSRSARPADFQVLLRDPGLQLEKTFGDPGENILTGATDAQSQIESSLPPVQILQVRDPLPAVRAEVGDPVIISGDGYGLAAAARVGLLDGNPPVLYSGALTPLQLQGVLAQSNASFIVTDSNRRRVWYFTAPRSPRSYTLPAGQTIQDRAIGYFLFDDREDTQSLAIYPGARSITASNYGAVFGTSPQYRPSNAFDGDPSTWWLVGSGSDPAGAWIQANFGRQVLLSSVAITQPNAWWLQDIRQVDIQFADGSHVTAPLTQGGRSLITFPRRLSTSIRITVRSARASPVAGTRPGVAISEVEIPGLHPRETIRVPNDLFLAASQTSGGLNELARHPITYLFERARSYFLTGPDEEARIVRRFEVPAIAPYSLMGTVHLNTGANDVQLDQVLMGLQAVRVDSSSRLLGNPALRGRAAFDGDDRTQWAPGGNVGQWLSLTFPPHTIDRLTVDTAVGDRWTPILRLRAVFSDGTVSFGDLASPSTGRVDFHFPSKEVSGVTFFIDRVFTPQSGTQSPVGISEIRIPGLNPATVDDTAALNCSGLEFALDGRSVSVRPMGTVSDLLAHKDLPLRTCDGAPVTLGRGSHDLIVGGGLQADWISLAASAPASHPFSASPPKVTATPIFGGGYDVTVRSATGPYYLVVGQNYDPIWKASIEGADLGEPMLLDGYSAGWRIDRHGSYTVRVRYARQDFYVLSMGVTAATLLFALTLLASWAAWRRRRSSELPMRQ